MIELTNETQHPFSTQKIEAIAAGMTDLAIEVMLVGEETMRIINRDTRGLDNPTDVLSFPAAEVPGAHFLGSVVINGDQADRVSQQMGHTADEEIALLFIHGLLHLMGYDHERDEGEMRTEEQTLIEAYSLPKSLIVRTEEE